MDKIMGAGIIFTNVPDWFTLIFLVGGLIGLILAVGLSGGNDG